MKTFGENLRRERKWCGYTQQKLAKLLHVKPAKISDWENNRVEPTLFNIIAITRTLDITFEDLIEDID